MKTDNEKDPSNDGQVSYESYDWAVYGADCTMVSLYRNGEYVSSALYRNVRQIGNSILD